MFDSSSTSSAVVGRSTSITIVENNNKKNNKWDREDELEKAIFQRLAIRRLNSRDRVYFSDF